MDELKTEIADTIKRLVGEGVRKQNIEIELIHFIREKLYKEEHE
jgi:hypothetical protein